MDSVAVNPTANLAGADVRQKCDFFNANHVRFLVAVRAPEPDALLVTQPDNAPRFDANTDCALSPHPVHSRSPITTGAYPIKLLALWPGHKKPKLVPLAQRSSCSKITASAKKDFPELDNVSRLHCRHYSRTRSSVLQEF